MFTSNEENQSRSRRRLICFVGLAVLILGTGVLVLRILNAPEHGETVAIPASLDKAIRTHFYESKHLGVISMKAFHCDTFRWGNVETDKFQYVIEVDTGGKEWDYERNLPNLGKWWKVLVSDSSTAEIVVDGWGLTALVDIRFSSKDSSEPCSR